MASHLNAMLFVGLNICGRTCCFGSRWIPSLKFIARDARQWEDTRLLQSTGDQYICWLGIVAVFSIDLLFRKQKAAIPMSRVR